MSSSVDKVTTGTYNFASFNLNISLVGAFIAGIVRLALGSASLVALLVTTQFSDQVRIRFN